MLSIIICSINDEKFRAVSANFKAQLTPGTFEIIRIGDARSLAEGYNRGIALARGETLIFSHDDIEFLGSDIERKINRSIARFDLFGIGGTDRLIGPGWVTAGPPHIFGQVVNPVQRDQFSFTVEIFGVPSREVAGIVALDGIFFAARRTVVDKIKFDEQTFDGFHLYDIDFSFAAHLAGFNLGVCCDIPLIHASGGSYDEQWSQHAERFVRKYAGKLSAMSERGYRWSMVAVRTKLELLDVMNPRYWPRESS